jgi:hypothetical protein
LIYFIFLLFLSGLVAGLVFTVRTLIGLLAVVLIQYPIAAFAGVGLEAAMVLGGLVAAQVGYFAGVLGRGALESTGLAWRGTHKSRVP